ncbi:hypothetical protein H2200_002214 [Cladophialophora chaetospira]|uniref:PA14 domain-containing protein n=1 Tax=Cladophialophora chaetospira TaxID=386627 RepID=A0AA39CNA9_9EURO|nr:hypothetical protein H2200_002214 [Cladophialophora chaetospira]
MLPTPSTTIVTVGTIATKTLGPITITHTATITNHPTAVTTITSITTLTNTHTITLTAATTSVTSTSTATVATVSPTGLAYYFYPSRNDDSDATVEIADLSNNNGYQDSGSVMNLNSIATGGLVLSNPDGNEYDGHDFAFIFQGYLYAADGPGVYTITSRSGYLDDNAAIWSGNNAYGNNWNPNNYDYLALFGQTKTATYTLLANDALPLTIFFANIGGPGTADFVITSPLGKYVDTSRFFVGDCGGGNFVP